MDLRATVTSKGQVTIPVAVRRALRLTAGTRVVFHVDGDDIAIEHPAGGRRARVERVPDFFELAGSVAVPPELRNAAWADLREDAWLRVARRRRS
jgi:antitoxin PrlF